VLIVPTYNFDVSLDDAGRSREHVTARVLDALRDRITAQYLNGMLWIEIPKN